MSSLKNCLFCQEIQEGSNVIFETEHFSARWDNIPLAPGHAEVVSKRHIQYFEQLNDDEMAGLLFAASRLVAVIKDINLTEPYKDLLQKSDDYTAPFLQQALTNSQSISTPPDGFNHGINDGAVADQTVPHLHYHVIPRRQGDIANPRGGIRMCLPVMPIVAARTSREAAGRRQSIDSSRW